MNEHCASPEQNRIEKLKLMAKFLQDRMSGNYEGLCESLTEDGIYSVSGDRFICPLSGTFVGRKAMAEAMRRLDVQFEFLDFNDHTYIIDGDNVALRWTMRWCNRGTGKYADFEGFAHIVFEGSLVKEYTTFIDTAGASRLGEWL